jgi:hypothetical protein
MAAFISKAELESFLGYAVDTDKATLTVDAACDFIRNHTGQDFATGSQTVLLDGTGLDTVLLPQVPVGTVSSVKLNGEVVTEYGISGSGMLLRTFPGVWTAGRQAVEVTYTYGYSEVPAEINMLALTIAARIYVQGLVTVAQVGLTNTTFATDALSLTEGEKNILSRYRVKRQDARVV